MQPGQRRLCVALLPHPFLPRAKKKAAGLLYSSLLTSIKMPQSHWQPGLSCLVGRVVAFPIGSRFPGTVINSGDTVAVLL